MSFKKNVGICKWCTKVVWRGGVFTNFQWYHPNKVTSDCAAIYCSNKQHKAEPIEDE